MQELTARVDFDKAEPAALATLYLQLSGYIESRESRQPDATDRPGIAPAGPRR
jgi:hypothetical protein